MYNFETTESPKAINRDFILSKISDAFIFTYYHGQFKIGEVYRSKLRKDKHASCGFYLSKSGKLIYNDLARSGEKYDAFAFVQKLYNLSFSDTLKRICADFGLVTGVQTKEVKDVMKSLEDFDKEVKKQTRIHFYADKWTEENLAYWKQYSITKQELEDNEIYPIKKLFINDIPISNKNNEIRYALTESSTEEMLTKIYCPEGGSLKWCSNIPLDIPFGLNTLKIGSKFSFTAKAQKDRIILKKFLPAVIASQNESESAMSRKVCKKLDFEFSVNYIGWDNDETGLQSMEVMKTKGFTPLHLPVEWLSEGIKDYSDLAKVRGLKAVEEFLKQNNLI